MSFSRIGVYERLREFPPASWWLKIIWFLSGSQKITLIHVDNYVLTVRNKKLMKITVSVIRTHTTVKAVLILWVDAGKYNSTNTNSNLRRPSSFTVIIHFELKSIISGNTPTWRPYIVQIYVGCNKGTSCLTQLKSMWKEAADSCRV
jgi:hypothetical protein